MRIAGILLLGGCLVSPLPAHWRITGRSLSGMVESENLYSSLSLRSEILRVGAAVENGNSWGHGEVIFQRPDFSGRMGSLHEPADNGFLLGNNGYEAGLEPKANLLPVGGTVRWGDFLFFQGSHYFSSEAEQSSGEAGLSLADWEAGGGGNGQNTALPYLFLRHSEGKFQGEVITTESRDLHSSLKMQWPRGWKSRWEYSRAIPHDQEFPFRSRLYRENPEVVRADFYSGENLFLAEKTDVWKSELRLFDSALFWYIRSDAWLIGTRWEAGFLRVHFYAASGGASLAPGWHWKFLQAGIFFQHHFPAYLPQDPLFLPSGWRRWRTYGNEPWGAQFLLEQGNFSLFARASGIPEQALDVSMLVQYSALL